MRAILGVVAAVGLFSTAASAYPTMIRNGYTQCATCHADPSGGTLLTPYGRAQSELLLSSRWGAAIAWVLPRFCAQVKAAAHFVEEITTDIASFTARDDQPDESLSPNPSREAGPHQIRAGSRLAWGARLASSSLRPGT